MQTVNISDTLPTNVHCRKYVIWSELLVIAYNNKQVVDCCVVFEYLRFREGRENDVTS